MSSGEEDDGMIADVMTEMFGDGGGDGDDDEVIVGSGKNNKRIRLEDDEI